ncbi:MAG: glycosyltransferase, partial [Gemmatimonadetes bacterium]|nr:glycosyltransferase [Gemmatimonadota bacterium]
MIYICIPTHNEQQTVGVVLWKLRQVLTDFPRDYQLLVADDASSDKTADVLEPYTRVLPLTVIRSEQRQGSAASLEMLLREAVRRSEYPKRDVIVTLQADFSEEPDDLVPLVKRLEAGADVAVGNKVSATKEARARRFARSLASFFVRRQKWPEGVTTPFEGYRAYRLYAIKRAMETRGNARLLRHEGWACHADLLRAVLPNARRVDVVDIDDRPDRLQRPRREKPFASAMQVRAMASGTEPPGLVGVDELDRIAQTASRSRERAAITAQSVQDGSGTGSRTNGSRTRQTARRDQGRTRSQANGSARSRPESGRTRPESGQSRQRSERSQQAAPGSGSKSAGGRARQPRSRSGGEGGPQQAA